MKKLISTILCAGMIFGTSAISGGRVIDNEYVVNDVFGAEILSDGTLSIYSISHSDDRKKIPYPQR